MKLRFFTILFTSLVLSLLGSSSVFAAAYVVDNLGDESDGECVVDTSFKEAVNCSNASGEADTILLVFLGQ